MPLATSWVMITLTSIVVQMLRVLVTSFAIASSKAVESMVLAW